MDKLSPVGVSVEQQGLRSPESNGLKGVSTTFSTPLLEVAGDKEATRLGRATSEDDDQEEQKGLYVSLVPLKVNQNGLQSHMGSAEMSGAEDQCMQHARKLNMELHRVDTMRTTTECALVSFSDIRSLSPDSDDHTMQPAMDTHSIGSSSLDLTIVTSGSDGMREGGETTESDSRLSSAAGNLRQVTVRPASATPSSAEQPSKGGLHGKVKHRFFSSDALDTAPDRSSTARTNPLKRLFHLHPLWWRNKAKSLPGYHHDENWKNHKGSSNPSQSKLKSKSDLDAPIVGQEDNVVVTHGPTWV